MQYNKIREIKIIRSRMIICGSFFVIKHAFPDVYARLIESRDSFRSTLKFSSVSPSLVLALRIMDATYLFTRLRMTSWGIEGEEEKASNQTELPNLVNLETYSWILWRCEEKERRGKQSQRQCDVMQLHAQCLYSHMCV